MRRTPRLRSLFTTILGTALALTVATPGIAGAASGFGDVEEDRYYTEPVAWLVDQDITTGIEAGCFGPEIDVTRGQVATFLHRLDDALGNEPIAGDHPFADVTATYQQAPVGWLYSSGITTGVSTNEFAPYRSITRGDFAVLLWRYAGEPMPSTALPFLDVAHTYQQTAVAWMAEEGITTGTSTVTFSPDDLVTRAEAATFLFRFVGPDEAVPSVEAVECTRPLRAALEVGGLTPAEAICAAPFLTGFDIDYLLDVVQDRTVASLDLIFAAAAVGNRCMTPNRIADLSRLFL